MNTKPSFTQHNILNTSLVVILQSESNALHSFVSEAGHFVKMEKCFHLQYKVVESNNID